MRSDPIQRLVLELARLPGIGERTAARLAFYIVRESQKGRPTLADDLARTLEDVVESVGLCSRCQNFCAGPLCRVCANPARDPTLLCVVEGVAELRAIDASGAFRGIYHVLHGALAPLDGVGPDELKLDRLTQRVEAGGIGEVIIATNADVEGDATALYLGKLLGPTGVKVTRLASGVPMGGELEYLDHGTLGRALAERREIT